MKKLILKKILLKINFFFQKFRFFETQKKQKLFRFFLRITSYLLIIKKYQF